MDCDQTSAHGYCWFFVLSFEANETKCSLTNRRGPVLLFLMQHAEMREDNNGGLAEKVPEGAIVAPFAPKEGTVIAPPALPSAEV